MRRKIRKYYLDSFGKFCITKYCIVDIIYRYSKNDTNTCLKNQQFISEWLGISKGTLSSHLKTLMEIELIKKNDLGFFLTDKYPFQLDEETGRESFVFIDYEIKEALENDFGFMTIEHFVFITTAFKKKFDKQKVCKKDLARMLLMDRKTINAAIVKFNRMGLLKPNCLAVTDECIEYFEALKSEI